MNNNFDVIVVGAGHAGIEAAYAAANMGSNTLLLTMDINKTALMPCNPSIGGLGKGHIVYEISALGGLMPKICSKTYLQARMLNTRKGPAVQGLRLQIHKYKYSQVAKEMLQQVKNLSICQGMVIKILTKEKTNKKKVIGIKLEDDTKFNAKSIVITSGTFLNGTIHIGFESESAGRRGEKAVPLLTQSLEKAIGIKFARLKTGTPPRILKSSVDFSKLEKQIATPLDYLFEFDSINVEENVACYITHTNEKTDQIIRGNFEKSALFGGKISGVGPRYCPSIEDKIKRHPDRKSHHVFVEPDGENLEEVYPAGLSTSLPLDVQYGYIQSMEGFEKAIISKPGYAIEYDFLQPNNLNHSLEVKNVEGLFFAGQVNGTTGYEEAAGQGIVAGINAHLKNNGQEPFVLNRTESYIGVMIDDLITIGVDEPYRMFTSRAERRLLLRQDNSFSRLMPYGKKFGLISDKLYKKFLKEQEIIQKGTQLLKTSDKQNIIFKLFHSTEFTNPIKEKSRTLLFQSLTNQIPNLNINDISSRALLCIHAEIRYDGYLEKERKEAEKVLQFQNLKIPENIKYSNMPGLSVELQQKLNYHQPKTIAQAQLIPGMTPAAISILIFKSKQLLKKC
ncbi:tRNA uridine-5-carboxymethylaminomethyl(34) synthesis enzyme MnmG [Candidatus Dependentiae bacterium]|nr:tRNA uridine-5-carboxymethylaminomethyl(34) synthesis enzyme MnmG [Candidatus Dependentiae bacterium]